jgi:hypothetical protein
MNSGWYYKCQSLFYLSYPYQRSIEQRGEGLQQMRKSWVNMQLALMLHTLLKETSFLGNVSGEASHTLNPSDG